MCLPGPGLAASIILNNYTIWKNNNLIAISRDDDTKPYVT